MKLPPKAKIIRYLFLGILFALFLAMFFKVKEGFQGAQLARTLVTSSTTVPEAAAPERKERSERSLAKK